MEIEFIFNQLNFIENIEYFEIILIIITFIYFLLPLPVTPLILFNSIYFKDYAFVVNLILITFSYISTYKIIHLLNLNEIINKLFVNKIIKKLPKNNFNEFFSVFFLRILIPIPILNYYLSIRNYNLRKSTISTILALIPYTFLLTYTSKDLIKGSEFKINYEFILFYFFYAISILIISKLFNKLNEK